MQCIMFASYKLLCYTPACATWKYHMLPFVFRPHEFRIVRRNAVVQRSDGMREKWVGRERETERGKELEREAEVSTFEIHDM